MTLCVRAVSESSILSSRLSVIHSDSHTHTQEEVLLTGAQTHTEEEEATVRDKVRPATLSYLIILLLLHCHSFNIKYVFLQVYVRKQVIVLLGC